MKQIMIRTMVKGNGCKDEFFARGTSEETAIEGARKAWSEIPYEDRTGDTSIALLNVDLSDGSDIAEAIENAECFYEIEGGDFAEEKRKGEPSVYITEDGQTFTSLQECMDHDDVLFYARQERFSKIFRSVCVSASVCEKVINDSDCKVEAFICTDDWKRVYMSCTAVEKWEIPEEMIIGHEYVVFKTDLGNIAKVLSREEVHRLFVEDMDRWFS